jgi:hypothetical protein
MQLTASSACSRCSRFLSKRRRNVARSHEAASEWILLSIARETVDGMQKFISNLAMSDRQSWLSECCNKEQPRTSNSMRFLGAPDGLRRGLEVCKGLPSRNFDAQEEPAKHDLKIFKEHRGSDLAVLARMWHDMGETIASKDGKQERRVDQLAGARRPPF